MSEEVWLGDMFEAPEVYNVDRPAWQRRAACRGMVTDAFMPGRGGSTAAAKAICIGCSVRRDCLAYALEDPEMDGVWGGTSKIERQRIHRQKCVWRSKNVS
jgi:WhiB family redox-sensing transcriptional regulator